MDGVWVPWDDLATYACWKISATLWHRQGIKHGWLHDENLKSRRLQCLACSLLHSEHIILPLLIRNWLEAQGEFYVANSRKQTAAFYKCLLILSNAANICHPPCSFLHVTPKQIPYSRTNKSYNYLGMKMSLILWNSIINDILGIFCVSLTGDYTYSMVVLCWYLNLHKTHFRRLSLILIKSLLHNFCISKRSMLCINNSS